MQKSDQINELAAALAKVQTALQPAIKDRTNPAYKSKYADLGATWDACRPLLGPNGLSIVQMPAPAEPGFAALETLLLHTSGQYISNYAQCRLVRDDAQGAGSAYTYLRRQSLAAFIGIVADDDDDGNAASQRPAQPARATNGATSVAPIPHRTPVGTQASPNGSVASEEQIKKVFALKKDLGWTVQVFDAWLTANVITMKGLSKADASWLIEEMTKSLNEADHVQS